MSEQMLVEVGVDPLKVADRRDAADGIAGASAHELGSSSLDRAPDDLGQATFVDAVGAGGKYKDGPVAVNAPENKRLYDLRDVAAQRSCGLYSGPGARWHHPHLTGDAKPMELFGNPRFATGRFAHRVGCGRRMPR
jgi:hypothetical protein